MNLTRRLTDLVVRSRARAAVLTASASGAGPSAEALTDAESRVGIVAQAMVLGKGAL